MNAGTEAHLSHDERDALLGAHCGDPFALLGPHPLGDGRSVIRALLPGAESVSVVALAALGAQSGGAVGSAEVEQARTALAERFEQVCDRAFLDAYVGATGAASCSTEPTTQHALIDLFLLEKAAYELSYEAANRPTWIGVPLRGLAALATRLSHEPTS